MHNRARTAAALVVLVAGRALAQDCAAGWGSELRAHSVSGVACAIAYDDDGPGPHARALYVAGQLVTVDGVSMGKGARWDGKVWTALNWSIERPTQFAVVGTGTQTPLLYIVDDFTQTIRVWDGQQLTSAPPVPFDYNSGPWQSTIIQLRMIDDGPPGAPHQQLHALVLAVYSTPAAHSSLGEIYRLEPGGWTRPYTGDYAAAFSWWDPDGAGAVGPAFYTATNSVAIPPIGPRTYTCAVKRVSATDPATLYSYSGELASHCTLAVVPGDSSGGAPSTLYVGGTFPLTAGAQSLPHICRWNGTGLVSIANDLDGDVLSLNPVPDELASAGSAAMYALGNFVHVGGNAASGIARWDGANWSSMGSGITATLNTLSLVHSNDDAAGPGHTIMYAVGDIQRAGDNVVSGAALWDGRDWSALGQVLNNSCHALLVTSLGDGAALYAGGAFINAGGHQDVGVAKWNGTAWDPTDQNFNNHVDVLLGYTDAYLGIVAGGKFTAAGGASASHIAMYASGHWSALAGGGTDGNVAALALQPRPSLPPLLFVGGLFNQAGGVANTGNIAAWNGSQWLAVGKFDDEVDALAVFQGQVYAAGKFHAITNTDNTLTVASHIARFDGQHWFALGAGVGGNVAALTVHQDGRGEKLYVGGSFSSAGGNTALRIARWDGANWSAVGADFVGTSVNALQVAPVNGRNVLFATGEFSASGATPASRIAYWNGTIWQALAGPGLGATGRSLAVFDAGNTGTPRLYVGGDFQTAGGQPLWFIASHSLCELSPCYANCDNSTAFPALNAADFQCFLNRFAVGNVYANCDGSTAPPILNVNDYQCMLNEFAIGCP